MKEDIPQDYAVHDQRRARADEIMGCSIVINAKDIPLIYAGRINNFTSWRISAITLHEATS